jgi:hypothetical protein
MNGLRNPNSLIKVLEPLLDKLGEDSWCCLWRRNLWNSRRPVVFQALAELLEPWLWPVAQALFDMVDAGKIGSSGHISSAMKEVIQSLQV